MIQRLRRSEDFVRVLRTRSRASSGHFALHHLPGRPSRGRRAESPVEASGAGDLSTGANPASGSAVESPRRPPAPGPRDTATGPDSDRPQTPETPGGPGSPGSAHRDRSPDPALATAPAPTDALWLGAVVPKKMARRAVTRNLVKRQIRALVADRAARLPAGLCVLRLRAPIDRARYASAASDALRRTLRGELETLLDRFEAACRAGRSSTVAAQGSVSSAAPVPDPAADSGSGS